MFARLILLVCLFNFVTSDEDEIINTNQKNSTEIEVGNNDHINAKPTENVQSSESSNAPSETITETDDSNITLNKTENVNGQLESDVLTETTPYTLSEPERIEHSEEEKETTTSEIPTETTTDPGNEFGEKMTTTEITEHSAKYEGVTDETMEPSIFSTEQSKKDPFFQKAIQKIVRVVETNILEEIPGMGQQVTSTETLGTNIVEEEVNGTEPRLDRLSDQIRSIINYYQTYGEVTVPNADIPDPLDIPDVKKNFGGSPTTFTNMKMYGLSNFTVAHINTDLNKMQVYVLVLMKRLVIIGNYSIRSWLSRASGPFNVTLLEVEAEGAAELKRSEDGSLQATDSQLDMSFKDAVVDFKNLGLVGSILQGVLSSAAPVLFEAIKPVVLVEINTRIRDDLNGKLKKVGSHLAMSGSRPPLDAAEEEGRNYVRENGFDPYHLRDFSIKQKIFTINITEFVLNGLSNFHRVGEIVFSMDEGTIQMGVHAATLDIVGRLKWLVKVAENFKREGYLNITVDHIQVRALVNQSLNVKTKPKLDKLDINVGKIRVNMEGAGRFDIIVEVMVNSLPDLIRHIIVDAIEDPLKHKLQQILNKIEPDVILEKSLTELDNLGL